MPSAGSMHAWVLGSTFTSKRQADPHKLLCAKHWCAAQVGIQEKTAFVVQGKGIAGGGLYKPIVSIPATIELLLVRPPSARHCMHQSLTRLSDTTTFLASCACVQQLRRQPVQAPFSSLLSQNSANACTQLRGSA